MRQIGFHQASPTGVRLRATIPGRDNFDAENCCLSLKKSMDGCGTDEDGIIEIIGSCNSNQRKELGIKYKSMYGKDLIEDLKSELSGDFEKLVTYMLDDWEMVFAKAIYEAIDGAGTKESVVLECLCPLSACEIALVKEAYQRLLEEKGEADGRNLEKDIIGDFSGHTERLLVALLQCAREEVPEERVDSFLDGSISLRDLIDMEKANADCLALYEAGEGRCGTDEGELIRIVVNRSKWHMHVVDELYKTNYDKSLYEALDSETSGDLGSALLLVFQSQVDTAGCYVRMLKEAMDGLGTCDKKLMRIILSRSEIDLVDIKEAFEAQEGKPLTERIHSETSGDYRKLLLKLCGETPQE